METLLMIGSVIRWVIMFADVLTITNFTIGLAVHP